MNRGAHGHAMGYNYNGKLRSAELLLREDGSVKLIRRAEIYFSIVGFSTSQPQKKNVCFSQSAKSRPAGLKGLPPAKDDNEVRALF